MIKKKWMSIMLLFMWISADPGFSQDILEAVRVGNLEKVRELLEKDPQLTQAKDDRYRTPLHLAVEGNLREIAELLTGKGAEIDAKEWNGHTSLHYSARDGNIAAAELLIARGAALDARNKDGYTPLHFAAHFDHHSIVELLIQKGAKVDIKENRGATPLLVSIWRTGNMDTARLLIHHGADINMKVEGSWVTPLAMAAQYGRREMIDLLLEKGAEVDEKNRVLLRMSVANGLSRLFKILYEKGADLSIGKNNGGHLGHFAAEGGSVEILRILAEKGFRMDQADRYGWTPLHYAAFNGQREAVEHLMSSGIDGNKRTPSGKSAFHLSTERGYKNVADLLRSRGLDSSPSQFPVLKGEYLGQKRPGEKPEVFAVGIVSSPETEHGSITMTPDGRTIYWTSSHRAAAGTQGGTFKVFSSNWEKGQWTAPQFAFFTQDISVTDDVPFLSPDGKRFFFMSKRPAKAGKGPERENYWVLEKTPAGWSKPELLDDAVNAMTIRWQISVAKDGTICFGSTDRGGYGGSDLYLSRLAQGRYSKPENLGKPINSEFMETAPFLAPDAGYLIFGREGQPNKNGLYVSFRDQKGNWTEPQSLGEEINADGASTPYVSPDGEYLFFNSGRNGNYDLYWVSTRILQKLKPREP